MLVSRADRQISKRGLKLQIFASDIDPDAVRPLARVSIRPRLKPRCRRNASVAFSPATIAGTGSRPDLRASVVFSVHDVLADPPFAKLDFVSCRNLLIYPSARGPGQSHLAVSFRLAERAAFFWLATCRGGRVHRCGLCGRLQTGRVFIVAWRPIAPRSFGPRLRLGDDLRLRPLAGHVPSRSRHADVLRPVSFFGAASYGPAAVFINAKLECLFFSGTHRSISQGRFWPRIAGRRWHGRDGVQTNLRSAIQGALRTRVAFVSSVGRIQERSRSAVLHRCRRTGAERR